MGKGYVLRVEGPNPASLGLHRVHLYYTISLLHITLSSAAHFNGSNGTAYTRPSIVQNNYTIPLREANIW
jgi:hypothetical protein